MQPIILMKRLLLFILILLSNSASIFACGFYPYGEDVRFSMYRSNFPVFKEFEIFQYSSNTFGSTFSEELLSPHFDENSILWSKRHKSNISLESIEEAIYETERIDFQESASNEFIRLLFQLKDTAAINYLLFAKKCSALNEKISDPWERNDYAVMPVREKLLQESLKRSVSSADADLKKRYAFLAIRLAYYNTQAELVKKIYETYFAGEKSKNIIDYWSMYFLCLAEKDPVKVNYYAAQVFANAPDKRFMVQQQYNDSIDVAKVVQLAKTKQEQSAVWLLAAIRNPYKCLPYMKKIYAIDPSSKALAFLLLREINKLEDWIYTPYYTEFAPSVDESNWASGIESFDAIYKERIRKDRLYAGEVLDLVKKSNMGNVFYPELWKSVKAYLLIMREQFQEALHEINAQKAFKNQYMLIKERSLMLNAFCEVAIQSKGNAYLSPDIKREITNQKEQKNYKFIFAIAKELEFRGNTTDAAILLSTLNTNEVNEDENYEIRNDIYWRTRNGSYLVYGNFYTDYFDYLDYIYTTEQLKALINRVEHENGKDAYSLWAYKRLHKELCLLYDLTGTKYMRKNELSAALYYYKQVPDSLWSTHPYSYLDANPFYTNFYSEHAYTDADTIKYTKVKLVQTLQEYLKLAENPQTKDRDYYYFLAANCYLNMTYYGNSWIMRRYQWSYGQTWERHERNDIDYFQVNMAKQYYLKAKVCSKTKKFAALCLRMAGRCEKYKLIDLYDKEKMYNSEINFEDHIFESNKYYRQLKNQYPDDYDELISNCESFTSYFLARR